MIHRLTHKHTVMKKPDVGEILLCGRRFTGKIASVWYRTPLDNAAWVEVPPNVDLDQMLAAATYLEAVAHIRRAWNEVTP